MLVLRKRGIYGIHCWKCLIWQGFHTNWYRHSNNNMVITSTIWEASLLVLLIEGTYKVCCWNSLGWHDMHTKFHDDQLKHSSNIKVITAISEASLLVLLMGGTYDVCCWDGFKSFCGGRGEIHIQTNTHP
jgi:hypothetical protein